VTQYLTEKNLMEEGCILVHGPMIDSGSMMGQNILVVGVDSKGYSPSVGQEAE
jgi:hypothetical protein